MPDRQELERILFRHAADCTHAVLGVLFDDDDPDHIFIVDALEPDGQTAAHCVRYMMPTQDELDHWINLGDVITFRAPAPGGRRSGASG